MIHLARGGGPPATGMSGAPAFEHDSAAAYLLNALPDDERWWFDSHLGDCAECRRELAELRPVVGGLLPLLYDEQPLADGEAMRGLGVGLRERILANVRDEPIKTAKLATLAPVTGTIQEVPLPLVMPTGTSRRNASAWPLAALFALATAGALIWGWGQREQARDAELEIAQLRAVQTAAMALGPSPQGPAMAHGRVVLDRAGDTGLLAVRGLPTLAPGRDYQVWLIDEAGARPSAVFDVDSRGEGGIIFEGDGGDIETVALTEEPDGGSSAPTSPVLLASNLPPPTG